MTKRSEPKVTLNITPGELTPAQLTKWNKVWVGSITVYGADQQFTTLSSGSPVVINKSVATGADDGFSGSGDFDNTDDWYEIGHPDSSTTYNTWFRFTGITIPAGATIEDAYLTLVQGQFDSGTVLKISAEKAANPTAPTSQSNHTSRVRTTANVAWTSGYSDYNWHNSPSFPTVIQELVNSYTYSGSAIQILVDNNGSTSGKEAEGSTYEDTGYAPKLYIRYHTGTGGSAPPAVGTDAASNLTATSATLNGNLTSLGSASSVQVSFQWGMDTNYGNTTTPQAKTSTGTFNASLTGLNPNTTYHVRSQAVGTTTTYGSDMLFTTSQSAAAAVITSYAYDVLGNLTQVTDSNSNNTYMYYDWLSRKTSMNDPDMGTWSYIYDNNGNLTSQTDAKNQTISMVYDAMNRLTNKNYPGSSMVPVVYTYDGAVNGRGLRTGMTDAAGTTSDSYDIRGRLVEETKTISSANYTTDYVYYCNDSIQTVTYPNPSGSRETVTNYYNGRGLPNAVFGSLAGSLVDSTTYNQLGAITQINLHNGLKTNYSYWGIDNGTTSYGKLWEIKTQPQAGGTAIQDTQYTWDATGNLTQRQNLVSTQSETETFSYDSLDRLISAGSSLYSQSYSYNAIGNITSMNGIGYTYGAKPHAVTAVGSTNYTYDANGNMNVGTASTWDVENRPTSVTKNGVTSISVYDGDGNRVKQTVGTQITLYINQYYEINTTTGVSTSYYYLGGQLVAQRVGSGSSYTTTYLHQDSLGSTSVVSNSAGASISTMKYMPFGLGRTTPDQLGTTKEFTGQRLDSTGLYYYNARYYDPQIGRFINPDSTGQNLNNPQTLNRYSYCINNPLNRTDPTGHDYISDHGGSQQTDNTPILISNTKIVDAVVAIPMSSFTPTSGLISDNSWWANTINAISDTIQVVGAFFNSEEKDNNAGLSLSGPSCTYSGDVVAYHTSAGGTGVDVNISASTNMNYNVTLYWSNSDNEGFLPMHQSIGKTESCITSYSNNNTYNVFSAPVTSTFSIGWQPPTTTFGVSSPSPNVPHLGDVHNMWVIIVPKVGSDNDPSSAASFYNPPKSGRIYLK